LLTSPFCGATTMRSPFQFTVTDTFLIEGRGLILSPMFPLDKFQFNGTEHVRVETPDGRVFEADADIKIPHVRPTSKVFQAIFVLRHEWSTTISEGTKPEFGLAAWPGSSLQWIKA
jgi:hypothetical protein